MRLQVHDDRILQSLLSDPSQLARVQVVLSACQISYEHLDVLVEELDFIFKFVLRFE